MRILHNILLMIFSILVFLATFYIFFPKHLQNSDIDASTQDNQALANTTSPEQQLLEKMTVEEKVGQLFIFGFDGTQLSQQNKQFLQDTHIGGVLLLSKNIINQNQLTQLILDLQSTNTFPLFISIDQEGGTVARLKWNTTLTTAQSEMDTPEEAYNIAKSRGEILRNLGINMNLAPVVEYITNPNSFMYKRVFLGSPEDAYQKGIAAVNGYSNSQIIPVIKHYPGHSDTSPDSHNYLPEVDITPEQWDKYTEPFSKIITGTNVDAVMIGHIKFPNIDNNPATLSNEIVTNRLINGLKYNGLVISDDMEMDALKNMGTYSDIAKQALLAGNDILIYSKYDNKDSAAQKSVYKYIVQEVSNGNMNIDDKVLKILRTKIKYNILDPQKIILNTNTPQ